MMSGLFLYSAKQCVNVMSAVMHSICTVSAVYAQWERSMHSENAVKHSKCAVYDNREDNDL